MQAALLCLGLLQLERCLSSNRRICWHLQVRQPAVVVGTSIGGTIALDFALNHPEDVAALVLIDAQVRSGPTLGLSSTNARDCSCSRLGLQSAALQMLLLCCGSSCSRCCHSSCNRWGDAFYNGTNDYSCHHAYTAPASVLTWNTIHSCISSLLFATLCCGASQMACT